ncbi:hypothetical protein [Aliifodinibius salipaludis]|nr:hypothetical protein [Aliifodinibius salipaludis]
MIRFFRNNTEDGSTLTWGFVVMLIAIGLIVGSFLVQVAMGLCPVP